jgi:hypothetical protein
MATTLLYASGAPSGRIQKADEMRTLLIERLANFVYPKYVVLSLMFIHIPIRQALCYR